jgi:hypothetical protein
MSRLALPLLAARCFNFLKLKLAQMKKYLLQTGWLSILILVWSCGPSLKVTSDYDKGVDFSKYKTFALYKPDSISTHISQLNQNRIINAIKNEMIKKGFHETSSSPDMLVNMVTVFKDKVDVSSTTNYYGYGGMYRPYYWGGGGVYGNTSYNVREYKDGSLIIDVIDASSNKLIWQGVGNKEIDGPIKDPDTKIPQAVASIMTSFPPGTGKKS